MSKNLEEPFDEKELEAIIAKAKEQVRLSEERIRKVRILIADVEAKLSVYRKLREEKNERISSSRNSNNAVLLIVVIDEIYLRIKEKKK